MAERPKHLTDEYCSDTNIDTVNPTAAHYSWHNRKGEESCYRGKGELSASSYLKMYGHLEGWDYVPRDTVARIDDSYWERMCSDTWEPTDKPMSTHYSAHNNRRVPTCGAARAEHAAYQQRKKRERRIRASLEPDKVKTKYDPVIGMPLGRVCELEDCSTVLSRYNRSTFCNRHISPLK